MVSPINKYTFTIIRYEFESGNSFGRFVHKYVILGNSVL